MKSLRRLALIGNHLPRHCGIATFTHDLHCAIKAREPGLETAVVAMTDAGRTYDYPAAVRFDVRADRVGDYLAAADFLNNLGFDAVSLQHEFGIFGGDAGGHIIHLLSRLKMPVVTNLHTILREPTPAQRDVMHRVIDRSTRLVVMSEKGREFLRSIYNVADSKIDVIAHGIPDVAFDGTEGAKGKFGFNSKTVILTFGLLSPSKGVEVMLDAMPAIIDACSNALYVVLGATHPNLVRDCGEAYRQSLVAQVASLGVGEHVLFVDRFVDQRMLLDYIAACDVYVTPYLNEAQMTSGTLAYSFGSGKAVVSTPYWHASELLSDGNGILVPFGDAKAMSKEVADLLTDPDRRQTLCTRAYAASRSMIWAQASEHYLDSFGRASEAPRPGAIAARPAITVRSAAPMATAIGLGHFLSMCDSTGMLQHAVFSVADRSHGYCIDDNARALLLSNTLSRAGECEIPAALTASFAAFVQNAWNGDLGRFRNFMSYDRRWLEVMGSEDSHGRALWALGMCSRDDRDPSRRRWAAALFELALPKIETFSSPRAWAFCLLGLDAYCTNPTADQRAGLIRYRLVERLAYILSTNATDDWQWFENVLAYDNARLSQALIQTGLRTLTPNHVEAGLRSLRWLMARQLAPSGCFRPIGTANFGLANVSREVFDQQPVEAAATISACLVAAQADGSPEWREGALRAFGWFFGENDLQTSMIDPLSGSCADGLHPDRRNENNGAESTLSYLLGLAELREFLRSEAVVNDCARATMLRSIESCSIARLSPRGQHVAIPLSESAHTASPPRSRAGRRSAVQASDRTPRP